MRGSWRAERSEREQLPLEKESVVELRMSALANKVCEVLERESSNPRFNRDWARSLKYWNVAAAYSTFSLANGVFLLVWGSLLHYTGANFFRYDGKNVTRSDAPAKVVLERDGRFYTEDDNMNLDEQSVGAWYGITVSDPIATPQDYFT